MSDTQNVCRLCLKHVPSNNCSPLDATFTEKFQLLDLELLPSVNPIVCNTCRGSLEESHKLKRTCSSSNKLIRFLKNYLGINHAVELKELIKGNNKKEDKLPKNGHVCRICLKSNDGDYKSIKDAKSDAFGSTLESCLSTLDENLTLNPLICKICIDALHKMRTFIKQLTKVENKVKSYRDKFPTEKVDLIKVLDEESLQLSDMDDEDVCNEETENRKRRLCEESEESAKKQKMDFELSDEEEWPPVTQNVNTNELPYYDFSKGNVLAPYRRKISIKDWAKQVEEIKAKLKWSDFTAKHKIVELLKALPELHNWFNSVADVITWQEFKEKLVSAFPEPDDYYCSIVRMVERKKRHTEIYVEYYNAKLSLLEPLKLSEEQIVSCLLGGVSQVSANCMARMGNCKNREDLLKYFKSLDDKHMLNPKRKRKKTKNSTDQQNGEKNQENDRSGDEPKKELIVVLEKKVLDVHALGSSDKVSDSTCPCCDGKGHSGPSCPLLANKIPRVINTERSEKAADRGRQDSNIIVVHEDISISDYSPTENAQIDKRASEAPKGNDAESTEKSSKIQKCACCDKFGHSSTDCPLIRAKAAARETAKVAATPNRGRQVENVTVTQENRSISVGNPPETTQNSPKVDKQASETIKEQSSKTQKCACCDKHGHSSTDCPLIRGKAAARETAKRAASPNRGRQTKNEIVVHENVLISDGSSSKTAQNLPKTDKQASAMSARKGHDTAESTQKSSKAQKCACCDKYGHSSSDCPLTTGKAAARETAKLAANSERGRHVEKVTAARDDERKPSGEHQNQNKCSFCDNVGHSSFVCPQIDCEEATPRRNNIRIVLDKDRLSSTKLPSRSSVASSKDDLDNMGHSSFVSPQIDSEEATPRRNNIRIVLDKDRLSSTKLPSRSSVASAKDDLVSEANKARWTPKENRSVANQKRCSCCDKIGHTNLDCPLLAPKRHSGQKQSPKDQPKCSNCNKLGHSSVDCLLVKVNTDRKSDKSNAKAVQKCSSCNELGHSSSNCNSMGVNEDELPQKSTRKCLCCNQVGHSSLDCPNLGINRKDLLKQSEDKTDKYEPVNIKKPAIVSPPEQKCVCCNKTGHATENCAFYSFFNRNNPKAAEGKVPQQSTSERKDKTDSPDQKCCFCDKYDHSSIDCFRTRFEQKHTQMKLPENPYTGAPLLPEPSPEPYTQERPVHNQEYQKVPKCDFCHKVGHRISDCFAARFDRKIYDSHYAPSTSSSRQCLYCGKFGHIQPDCPKNKPTSRRSDFRRY